MRCPKCKGKMFSERYYDFVRSYDAWKCYSCGEVVDPVIMANRRAGAHRAASYNG